MVGVWTVVVALVLVFLSLKLSSLPLTLWQFYRKCQALKSISGWSTHWFWGNLHQLDGDEKTLMKLTRFVQDKRLKVFKLWMGPLFPMVCVTHCSAVQQVIKLPKAMDLYAYLLPWLGEGLLISEGKKWFRNRRLLTPAFHYEILRGYVPVVNSCLEIFLKKWVSATNEGRPVLVFEDVSKLSLDIIMRCAFSSESNCQLSEDHPYANAVPELSTLISKRFYKILYRNDFIYSCTVEGKRFKQACKVAHDFTESVIRERRKMLGYDGGDSGNGKRKDFLDILLTAQDEEGRGLTDREIRDEADTFMFEGHDTTTSGMSWTLYCLAKHPEHQDKVREEVHHVLMGREWLEYEDLKELNYTTWCIKEAMRLYPPVYDVIRRTAEDTEIAGHVIPKGVMVIIDILRLHRQPDTWEDPDEYNPLRFQPSNTEGRHPYAYVPFSAGYRNCIGQNFALNEEKMVIASIINQFQIALDETHEVKMVQHIILRATADIKLSLRCI